MFQGYNIVCFGTEKWEYPGFQQSVMKFLSLGNRIIYINPLGLRKASLERKNISIYLAKLRSLFAKNRQVSDNVLVCNAFQIPLIYSKAAQVVNRLVLGMQFLSLLKQQDFKNYILWIGHPTAVFVLEKFSPMFTVYNPVDRYYAFSFVKRKKILNYERKIAEKSDVVLCTSQGIRDDLIEYNKYCYTISRGVDFDHFNSAFNPKEVPEDIRDIPRPIIGYIGALCERVNYGLIRDLAVRYPNASVVLIGRKKVDLSQIEQVRNIQILGFRDFGILPLYLKEFTACIIPYVVNELINGIDPIKLREYLCQGKPVIATDFFEARKWKKLIYIGKDKNDFIEKVGLGLQENGEALVERRIEAVKRDRWPEKIEIVSSLILDRLSQKYDTKLAND